MKVEHKSIITVTHQQRWINTRVWISFCKDFHFLLHWQGYFSASERVSKGKIALRGLHSSLKIEEILNLIEKKVIVEQRQKSDRT